MKTFSRMTLGALSCALLSIGFVRLAQALDPLHRRLGLLALSDGDLPCSPSAPCGPAPWSLP